MSDPTPQVHGPPHRPSIFEPVDWEAERIAWQQQERELEAERQRQLARHPAHCLCTHCQHRRADHDDLPEPETPR